MRTHSARQERLEHQISAHHRHTFRSLAVERAHNQDVPRTQTRSRRISESGKLERCGYRLLLDVKLAGPDGLEVL